MRSTVLPRISAVGRARREQRDRALAGHAVALHSYAPRQLVILGLRHYRPDSIPSRLIRACDEQRMSAADDL